MFPHRVYTLNIPPRSWHWARVVTGEGSRSAVVSDGTIQIRCHDIQLRVLIVNPLVDTLHTRP